MEKLEDIILRLYYTIIGLEDSKRNVSSDMVAKFAHQQNNLIKDLKKVLRIWYKTHDEDPDISSIKFHFGIKPFTKKDLNIKNYERK